jgi:hypothetical protein
MILLMHGTNMILLILLMHGTSMILLMHGTNMILLILLMHGTNMGINIGLICIQRSQRKDTPFIHSIVSSVRDTGQGCIPTNPPLFTLSVQIAFPFDWPVEVFFTGTGGQCEGTEFVLSVTPNGCTKCGSQTPKTAAFKERD